MQRYSAIEDEPWKRIKYARSSRSGPPGSGRETSTPSCATMRGSCSCLLVVGPVRLQGLDAYRKTWIEQFFPWHGGTGRFELVDLKVSAHANVALATALLECAGTEDGKKVAFTLRLTIGLEKHNGEWNIVHEHHSQPLAFDTAGIGTGSS